MLRQENQGVEAPAQFCTKLPGGLWVFVAGLFGVKSIGLQGRYEASKFKALCTD